MNAKLYPTSNQERQMHCVRHTQHAMPCKAPALRLHVATFQPEVVTVHITDPVTRAAALETLTAAGMIVQVRGSKVSYA